MASLGLADTFAQNGTGFTGNGYYRIRNFASERYIYVTDNKDYYDMSHDREDFQAIQLWRDINRAVISPASVIYMEEVGSNTYDLKAQGTGVHALTGYYVNARKMPNGVYEVSATKSGATKYLADKKPTTNEQGEMGTYADGESLNYRRWVVDRITTDHASNYVGIKPTIQVGDMYYQPYYASFPFKAVSPDMNIYCVNEIVGNYAKLKKIEGEVPAGTPVLIECTSNDPSQNRLQLLTSTSAKVTGNLLSGTYFCNATRPAESTDAYTKLDATTMRIFDIVDGNLVLTNNPQQDRLGMRTERTFDPNTWKWSDTTIYDGILANTSYLKTSAETAEELIVVLPGMGINDVKSDRSPLATGVYSISGTRLRQTNELEGLPAGLYIVGGKKVVVK